MAGASGERPRPARPTTAPPGDRGAGAAEGSGRAPGPHFAGLGLGTNNCRLLVARPAPIGSGAGFRVVDAFSRIVRLGEGLEATGALSEAAMARTLDALKICAGKIAQRRVCAGRSVATEACRRAANCGEFLARVRDEVGLELEIISTAEEARLVVTGCAPLLHPRTPYAIVFDIGGGRPEIGWGGAPPPPPLDTPPTATAPARRGRRFSARSRCRSASSPSPSGSAGPR